MRRLKCLLDGFEMTYRCIERAAAAAKRGGIRRDLTFVIANDLEMMLKSLV